MLAQPEMMGSFNQLLLSLSLYDLIYLIMSLLLFAIPQLSDTYKEVIYPWIFIFLYVSCTYVLLFWISTRPRIQLYRFALVHISRVGSVFMTLSVTPERFTAIVYPLKRTAEVTHGPIPAGRARRQSRGSSKGAKILILVSTLIAVAYNIPRYGFTLLLGINHNY